MKSLKMSDIKGCIKKSMDAVKTGSATLEQRTVVYLCREVKAVKSGKPKRVAQEYEKKPWYME